MSSVLSPASTEAPQLRAAYLQGLLLASLGAVCFSAKVIAIKLLYRHGIDPVTLIALRMLLSVPFFLLVAVWTWHREPRLTAGDLARIAGLGVLGYYASSMLDFLGLQYVSAGLERLIQFLVPTFVLLLGVVAFKRRVTARQWLSLVLAYAGIVLVFWHEVHVVGSETVLGAGLVFASTFTYAIYLLLSGELLKRVGALRLAAIAMIVSALAALVQYAILRPLPSLFDQTAPVWGLSLVNATLCTVLPVFLTMMAVARIGAGSASQATMIGPVSTLFLAAWLLGEPITALQMAGTVLVLSGMALLSSQKASTPVVPSAG